MSEELGNYAYRIVDPVTGNRETVCKVRGIKVNYSVSQTVNFDVINALELRGDDTETVNVHTEHKIKRKAADGKIIYSRKLKTSFMESHSLRDAASVTIRPVPSVMLKRGVG